MQVQAPRATISEVMPQLRQKYACNYTSMMQYSLKLGANMYIDRIRINMFCLTHIVKFNVHNIKNDILCTIVHNILNMCFIPSYK